MIRNRRLWTGGLGALLVAVLLVAGSSPLVAGADNQAPAARDTAARFSGMSAVSAFGTAWVPQQRGKFALWRPVGWGTQVRVKAAGVGDQWVHIPIPWPLVLDSVDSQVRTVQFCAQSSNGAQTRPIQWDVWGANSGGDQFRVLTTPIAWPATNSLHCEWLEVPGHPHMYSLGFSVLLHFANTTDQITLGEAIADTL